MDEEIGYIDNYYTKVGVAVLNVTNGSVQIGDKLSIKGATTDFEMVVDSLQIDRADVDSVSAGTLVGLKVPQRVRKGDKVYKV
ncbi:MAG: translation elongation factor-like protein [Candidatus Heimdallarchaeota archaeon]